MEAIRENRRSKRSPLSEEAGASPRVFKVCQAQPSLVFLCRACDCPSPCHGTVQFRGLWDRRRAGGTGVDAPRLRWWLWGRTRTAATGIHVIWFPRQVVLGPVQGAVAVSPTTHFRHLWWRPTLLPSLAGPPAAARVWHRRILAASLAVTRHLRRPTLPGAPSRR